MKKIVLSTLNARYIHSAFGLRYLKANLGPFKESAVIREFTLKQDPELIASRILEENPDVVGFGVYIWNVKETEVVISVLKSVRPDIIVVLGGPEVSYEAQDQRICQIADFVIQGEADFKFREFIEDYFSRNELPHDKFIQAPLPDIHSIELPYDLYYDEDVANRVIYVEASRGCPYKCEYCLSSLDLKVRPFELEQFLLSMDQLIKRGARSFKFVDRTFNLKVSTGVKILQFFLERMDLGLFLHFEMIPDRLPEPLRELVRKFPPGSLQFEIGIQTLNPEIEKLIQRKQNHEKMRENFRFLTDETHCHIHADLIFGLPGESLESFARGFDLLYALRPHEIQVGILKRLKGTPITRRQDVKFSPHPPFSVLKTDELGFETVQTMRRFSRFWDLYANSGNFPGFMRCLMTGEKSPFWAFYRFSKFLAKRHPENHGISLLNRVESAWLYLKDWTNAQDLKQILIRDYCENPKRDVPLFLRPHRRSPSKRSFSPNQRQKKFLGKLSSAQLLLSLLLGSFCLAPESQAIRVGLSGNTQYAILSSTNNGFTVSGDLGFGAGLHFDFGSGRARTWEVSTGALYRKYKYGYSVGGAGSVNGFSLPLLVRYNLSNAFSIGGGFFYWIVTTEGCFDDNDYGGLASLRFQSNPLFGRTRLFVDLAYHQGTQSCFLFGGEKLNGVLLSVGLSFSAYFR